MQVLNQRELYSKSINIKIFLLFFQMNKFILLSIFIALACSFVLKDQLQKIKDIISTDTPSSQEGPILSDCTNNQTNSLYNAIAVCQMPDVTNTVDCVMNTLWSKTGQKWDVFVKGNNSNAGVKFWVYNNCQIYLNNYGNYSRNYVAWPSALYNASKEIPNDANCTSSRNSTIASAINQCEMADEANSAYCILNTLKTNISEYWDVYAASPSAQSSVRFWFYDNCSLTYQRYGRYNRTYTVWKAY